MGRTDKDTVPGYLPEAPAEIKRIVRGQTVFGGLSDRGDGGEILSMSGLAPAPDGALTVRAPRRLYLSSRGSGTPHGVTRHRGVVVLAQGSKLYVSAGRQIAAEAGSVSDTDKTFVSFGDDLFILPDGLVLRGADGTPSLEPLALDTGLLTGSELDGRTVTAANYDFGEAGFRAGDGIRVEIPGFYPAEEGIMNARVVYVSHNMLRVETPFPQTGTYVLRVTRPFPAAGGLCAVGERLWGCADNRMFACEAGNPFNWCAPVSGAPEKDPVSLSAGTDGVFTACIGWQGYPAFFMADRIIRVVGRSSGPFTVNDLPAPGVAPDAGPTLCEVGGVLYYRGNAGVYRFTGTYPERLGGGYLDGMTGGCGGTDGRVWYLSATLPDGPATFLYDPEGGSWFRQDAVRMVGMTSALVGAPTDTGTVCLMQDADGAVWITRSFGPPLTGGFSEADLSGAVTASVEFVDERTFEPDGVRLLSVALRAEGENGRTLTVSVKFDGDTSWRTLGSVTGTGTEAMYRLPVLPRRAEWFRLRLSMTGAWRVRGLWQTLERAGQ